MFRSRLLKVLLIFPLFLAVITELDAVNQRHEEEAREHQEEREKWREETAAKLSDKDRVRYNYHGT